MQAPAPEAASAAVQTIDAQVAAIGPQSFGDRVLNSMQGVSTDFRESMTRVAETLRSDNAINAQQMLSLQLEVNLASVQMELVSKAISRSNQNLDQLVRVQ
ncbi:Type III secretion needle MxiH like protein [compost metagenome]